MSERVRAAIAGAAIALLVTSGSGCLLLDRPRYGLSCDDDRACGEGYLCRGGRCVPPRFADATSPDGVGGDVRDGDGGAADGTLDGGAADQPAIDSHVDSGASLDAGSADRALDSGALDARSVDTVQSDVGLDAALPDLGGAFARTGELANPTPTEGDYFGQALVFVDDTLIVGRARMGGSAAGDVLVYRSASDSTWHLQQELAPAGLPAGSSNFGYSLAAGGSWLAVGDPNLGALPGEVHLFERVSGTWIHQGSLARSTSNNGDRFGDALVLSADGAWLAVGAPGEVGTLPDSGSAHAAGGVWFFGRTGGTWTEQSHQLTPTPGAGSVFGGALAMAADGATCVVGAGDEDVPGAVYGGAIYVFRRSGDIWSSPTRITTATPYAGDEFGYALAFTGSTVAVGMPGADGRQGRVELYTDNGSELVRTGSVLATVRAPDERFGFALTASHDVLLVGTVPSQVGDAGPVSVLVRNGASWSWLQDLEEAGAITSDGYGEVLAVSADTRRIALGQPRLTVGSAVLVGRVVLHAR